MKKLLNLHILAILVALAFSSCGGGSNAGDVCNAASAKVFDLCSSSNPDHVAALLGAFAGYGLTVDDIQNASEGELSAACQEELAGTEMTDEEKEFYLALIAAQTDCETTVNLIAANL